MKDLLLGLATGVLFGFLLQRSRVLRYDVQVGALRLLDMTIVKFMLSAVVVGSIGIHVLWAAGAAEPDVKAAVLGANIVGGLLFGIGWGLLGYCPGTSVGALGEGRWDAVWGILGMLVGGALYAEVYSPLKRTLGAWGDLGAITLDGVLHVSAWVVIAALAVVSVPLFVWFEKRHV